MKEDVRNNRHLQMITIIAGIILFAMVSVQTAYAEDEDIDSGVYDGVPWKITSEYELVIGEPEQEYSLEFRDTRKKGDYPWYSNRLKIKRVSFAGTVVGNGSCEGMFYNSNMKEISLTGFDTSNVTSLKSMLYGCNALTQIDVTEMDTCNVTNMEDLFNRCNGLVAVDISKWDTGNVTSMKGMFDYCESLTSLDLSNLNMESVLNMEKMFSSCHELTGLDLHNLNTGNVTNMKGLLQECRSLTDLNLTGLKTSNVTNMSYMFSGCKSLSFIDISEFDTSKVTNMEDMFYRCSALQRMDVSSFDTSVLQKCSYMFNECSKLSSIKLPSFDGNIAINFIGMFRNCPLITKISFDQPDIIIVKNWDTMFEGCERLKTVDLSSFDTRNCINTTDSFKDCIGLEAIALGQYSLVSEDLPKSNWTRLKLLNGELTDGPTITNLTSYTGADPGWYSTNPCWAGHKWSLEEQVAPTCTNNGLNKYQCDNCGITKQESIDAVGHSYDSGKVTKKASTVAAGVITFTCQNDSTHKYTKAIPKLNLAAKATKTSFIVKYSKVKTAKQTIKTPVKVTGYKTALTYTKTSGKSNFTVNKKTGTITVKKGTKKGTYSVKIKVKTAASTKYTSAVKTVSVKVKVK